jgi:hypothetical protein
MHEQPETRDEMLKTNPKYKNVNGDIIDAVMFDKEYEAEIQDRRDREINVFEEPEMRMLKITLKGKHNKSVNMDHMMDEKPETTDIIDAVMYEKPKMRDVIDNITDPVMLKHGVRGWHQDPLRKGTQHVGEDRDEGWDTQDHRQGQVRQEQECEKRDEQEQHGRLDHRTKVVLLSV